MRSLKPEELQKRFPKLQPGNFEICSRATARYNCVAFANNDERHWWQAGLHGSRHYWPPGIKQDNTLDAWVEMFKAEGYEVVQGREVEVGFEKVALYVDLVDMGPSHVALSEGRAWKSKLGKGVDIEHSDLSVLEGDQMDEYGIVEVIMRRPAKK